MSHAARRKQSKKGTVLASPRAGTVPFLAVSTQMNVFSILVPKLYLGMHVPEKLGFSGIVAPASCRL